MEIVIDLFLQEVAHVLVDGLASVRGHRGTTEFDFRLTLEYRFLHIDGDCRHQSVTDVAILILAIELLDGLGDMFLEGTLMGTALGGMLTIDEGIVLLSILVGMGESYLDVLALHVNNLVEALVGHIVLQEVLQAMTAQDTATIVHDGKPRVQVSIVAKHRLHDVIVETIVLEERIVWLEEDVGTIFVLRILRLIAL